MKSLIARISSESAQFNQNGFETVTVAMENGTIIEIIPALNRVLTFKDSIAHIDRNATNVMCVKMGGSEGYDSVEEAYAQEVDWL